MHESNLTGEAIINMLHLSIVWKKQLLKKEIMVSTEEP